MVAKDDWRWGVIALGGPWHCTCCGKLKRGWWTVRINRPTGRCSAQVCKRCAKSIAGRYNEYGNGN